MQFHIRFPIRRQFIGRQGTDHRSAIHAGVKKVQIATDVSASGVKVGTFKVDPWLWSVGVGKRF